MNASDERKLSLSGPKSSSSLDRTSSWYDVQGHIPRRGGRAHPGCAGCAQEDNGAKRPDVQVHPSCNYSSKIIEPIQSRCAVFRFRPLADDQVRSMVVSVAEGEG